MDNQLKKIYMFMLKYGDYEITSEEIFTNVFKLRIYKISKHQAIYPQSPHREYILGPPQEIELKDYYHSRI